MDVGALFLTIALGMLVTAFVIRPLLPGMRRDSISTGDQKGAHKSKYELSALMAERDRLISAIQELEFDHALGKIPDEVYPEHRNTLRQHAAQVLRKIDEMLPASTKSEGAPQVVTSLTTNDDELEAMIVSHRQARRDLKGGFCAQCGKVVLKSDKFCPHCGSSLSGV
jgi:hypothetical protein